MLIAEFNEVQKSTCLTFDRAGARDLIRFLSEVLEKGENDAFHISDTFSDVNDSNGCPLLLTMQRHSRSEKYQVASLTTLVLHEGFAST